jgi:AraC-like DNA-binding protein
MNASNENSTLSDVLKDCVIPWVERDGMSGIFTAISEWEPLMTLPAGMTATHKPLRGKRVATRGGRAYGSTSVIEARWIEDGMQSTRTPKLCFAITGAIIYQVHDYVLHCQPGHGILLPPGTPFAGSGHTYLDQTKQYQGVCEFLQMMPYHGGLICWLSRRRFDGSANPHVQESTCSIPHSRVPFFLNQLVDEALKNQPYQQLICDSLLKITLALLQRELENLPVLETGEIHDNEAPLPSDYRPYSIKHAQEYIENNLREPLSIDKVARYVCMSRTVFTEQFRDKTGKTFSQYVQDLRLEEACKLLSGSGLAIKHIASAVGLQPNRMRALFRERKATTPVQYRNRYRKRDK